MTAVKKAVKKPTRLQAAMARVRASQHEAKDARAHYLRMMDSYMEMTVRAEQAWATYQKHSTEAEQHSRRVEKLFDCLRQSLENDVIHWRHELELRREQMTQSEIDFAKRCIERSQMLLEEFPARMVCVH